ncbi:MAG TPA: hypothetical protein VMU18_11840 [Rhodoblastus sp.]|nr:hypothetical protein [Rhodoblastus sp.]
MVLDAFDAAANIWRRVAALGHFHVFELVGGRMRLIEAPRRLHRNVSLARFFGQGRPPARKILNIRIELFAGFVGETNRRVNMDVLAVGVHHEHIFMARKLPRECRPRRVHKSFLVGPRLGAQDHMGEVTLRA